tara:strand:+ start:253 stop:570 length:318 start_codon:yes stop_codon:yes gene_type:complete
MCCQAAAQQQLVFGLDAALQLLVIALQQPPHRHLLDVHDSSRLESGRQRLKMWIALLFAAHDRNDRMLEPAQSARYVAAATSLPSGALDGHHCQPPGSPASARGC